MTPYIKYIAFGTTIIALFIVIALNSNFPFWNESIFLITLSISLYLMLFQTYHFFKLKKLVYIKSFNLFSLIPIFFGFYKLFVPEDYFLFSSFIQSNIGFGICLILLGLVSIPRYLIFKKLYIHIYLMDGQKIKYSDLINIDYKNEVVLFETTETTFQLHVFKYNTEFFAKVKWSLNRNEALMKAKSNLRNAQTTSAGER